MASHDPLGPAPQDPTESWASAPTSELPAQPPQTPAPGASAGQPRAPQPSAPQPPTGQPSASQPTAGASPHPGAEPGLEPAYAAAAPGAARPGGPAGPAGPGGTGYGSSGAGGGGYGPTGPGGGYGPSGAGGGGYGPTGGPPVPPGGPTGGGRPGWWRRTTSTTGGLVAVAVAGTLAVLLVLGLAGVAAFAVGRGLTHRGDARISQAREDWNDGMGPGQRGLRQGGPQRGMGGLGNGQGNGGLGGNGKGLGSVLGGAAALGNVQHGEFTVTGSDGKATVMTLQRGAVTKAGPTSLSVRSDDGFTATYTLDSTTRTPGRAAATGDVVLVVAQKQGSKAVLVRVTR